MSNVETQNTSYRRGLVLGLTMAEVTILIIFVLLLGFAALLAGQRDKRKEAEHIAKARQDTIISLQEQLSTIQEQLPTGMKDIEELHRELVSLSATKQQLTEFHEAAQEAGFSPEPDIIRDALKAAREYKDIIAGKGTEVPSCWVQDDGTIEYIYDINLTPNGLVVQETDLPHRAKERQTLQVKELLIDQEISEAAFLSATSNLFEWSKSNKCRFFVRVFDFTGPTQKSLYQSRLKTVEAHFYKKLMPKPQKKD